MRPTQHRYESRYCEKDSEMNETVAIDQGHSSVGAMESLGDLAELPRKLEDLQKRMRDESEEARRRRARRQGCPRVLSAACGTAMVAIGKDVGTG